MEMMQRVGTALIAGAAIILMGSTGAYSNGGIEALEFMQMWGWGLQLGAAGYCLCKHKRRKHRWMKTR